MSSQVAKLSLPPHPSPPSSLSRLQYALLSVINCPLTKVKTLPPLQPYMQLLTYIHRSANSCHNSVGALLTLNKSCQQSFHLVTQVSPTLVCLLRRLTQVPKILFYNRKRSLMFTAIFKTRCLLYVKEAQLVSLRFIRRQKC